MPMRSFYQSHGSCMAAAKLLPHSRGRFCIGRHCSRMPFVGTALTAGSLTTKVHISFSGDRFLKARRIAKATYNSRERRERFAHQ